LLGASLILILGLAGAATYEFGSKVVKGDTDEGKLLYDFPAPLNPNLGYWDVGINPGVYDVGDFVYLDIDNDLVVDAQDIRLSIGGAGPAGSKVTSTDNDINAPLLAFAPPRGIFFLELDGIPGYSADDTVYITAGPNTVSNDIRLYKVSGLNAGSRVLDFHGDINKPVLPMTAFPVTPWTGPIATIRFYNANGNYNALGIPVYDNNDAVYLDVSLPSPPTFGFVVANDIRLSV
jgi:hypothetical protein